MTKRFGTDFDISWPQNHAVQVVIWACEHCGQRKQTDKADRPPTRWVYLMPHKRAFCSSDCFNDHYVELRKKATVSRLETTNSIDKG